jgi:hypothetical protein
LIRQFTNPHPQAFQNEYSCNERRKKEASLTMNWSGQIVLTFNDDREYALKLKGLFHNKFILENKNGEKVILFEPKFNWREFHYNYTITYDITNENEPQG